jgi:hypothetical protein
MFLDPEASVIIAGSGVFSNFKDSRSACRKYRRNRKPCIIAFDGEGSIVLPYQYEMTIGVDQRQLASRSNSGDRSEGGDNGNRLCRRKCTYPADQFGL